MYLDCPSSSAGSEPSSCWDNLQTVGYLKNSFLIYPVSEVPPHLSINDNLSKHYWEDRGPNLPVHSLTPGEA